MGISVPFRWKTLHAYRTAEQLDPTGCRRHRLTDRSLSHLQVTFDYRILIIEFRNET